MNKNKYSVFFTPKNLYKNKDGPKQPKSKSVVDVFTIAAMMALIVEMNATLKRVVLVHSLVLAPICKVHRSLYTLRSLLGKLKIRCVYYPNTIASLHQRSLKRNIYLMCKVSHNIPNL